MKIKKITEDLENLLNFNYKQKSNVKMWKSR